MIRSTILYRRFWYVKRRNSRNIGTYIRIFAILAILSVFAVFINKSLYPNLAEISEIKAKAMISEVVSSAVNSVFDNGLKYEQLVTISRSRDGQITSIETDMKRLNLLSSQIIKDVGSKLAQSRKFTVSAPMGALLGNTIFAGMGPNLNFSVQGNEYIEANFESQFSSTGINQTKHRIVLLVRTDIKVVAPLIGKNIEVWTEIPVCETIIVGETPQVYFEGVSLKDFSPGS
jgi:sporulation protein YunB